LEQFLKKDDLLKNYQKDSQNPNHFKRNTINEENSRV
jgi:hypothetical protein